MDGRTETVNKVRAVSTLTSGNKKVGYRKQIVCQHSWSTR